MRNNIEDVSAFNTHLKSGKFSSATKKLTANAELTKGGQIVNFFDPNGGTWDVKMPAVESGYFFTISNTGTSGALEVKTANGDLITELTPGSSTFLVASELMWTSLYSGSSATGVFTNLINGLVPAPHSAVPGNLFLRDDGQWVATGSGPVSSDAYKFITDGTTIATAGGADTFKLRSSSGSISAVVTNNEVTHGDNANFDVVESQVDHDALNNFVGNEHIDHSSVSMTAGLGLSGGGDLTITRDFAFAPSELLVLVPPALTDYAVMDLAAGGPRRTLWSEVNKILDHNQLFNYSANRHIDHSTINIVAGLGLNGGGDLTTSRSLAVDITEFPEDLAPVSTDFVPIYSVAGIEHRKIKLSLLGVGGGIPEPTADGVVYGRQQTSGGVKSWQKAVSAAGDSMTGALVISGTDATLKLNSTTGTTAGGVILYKGGVVQWFSGGQAGASGEDWGIYNYPNAITTFISRANGLCEQGASPPTTDRSFKHATTDFAANVVPAVQGYIYKAGANVRIAPLNGNLLWINGVNAVIPDDVTGSFVELAPTGLATNTLHYVYAVRTGNVVTSLEASTTPPTIVTGSGTSKGVRVKNGDITRTFVGMVYPEAGPVFTDTPDKRLVRSWLNRTRLRLQSGVIVGSSSAIGQAAATVIGSTGPYLRWLSFAGESVDLSYNGDVYGTAGVAAYSNIGVDGVMIFGASGGTMGAGNAEGPHSPRANIDVGQGFHTATVYGWVASAATANWYGVVNPQLWGTVD